MMDLCQRGGGMKELQGSEVIYHWPRDSELID